MGNPCRPCAHPRIAEIDRALVTGMPREQVGRKFGLTSASLRRHEIAHITDEARREILLDVKRDRAQHVADELNDERLDIAATYDGLARRVGMLIDKAEENGDDSLALASMEGLRRVLRDIASMQGKLAQQLTVQVSLMESPEWVKLRDMLETVFAAHPEAGQMFLALAKRERLSITHAP